MSIERYKQLAKGISAFNNLTVKTFIPHPTDADYKRGYISRYFIRKVNDPISQIYEVSSDNFTKFKENPFWVAVSIRWKISGSLTTKYNQDGSVNEYSVTESNSRSISTAAPIMNNLKLFLPNLTQFYKK